MTPEITASVHISNMLYDITQNNLKIDVSTIFELGCRYGEDTIALSKIFSRAKIFGFECNPTTLSACRKNIQLCDRIKLIEAAVTDHDGWVDFYPINVTKSRTTWSDGNQGASSIFKANNKYEIETYVQDETTVRSRSLSSIMIEHNIAEIDILWMDIQGAELLALKGLGKHLGNIKIIYCEVQFIAIYDGQPLFAEILEFLEKRGFHFHGFSYEDEYAGDAIFISKNQYTHLPLGNRCI